MASTKETPCLVWFGCGLSALIYFVLAVFVLLFRFYFILLFLRESWVSRGGLERTWGKGKDMIKIDYMKKIKNNDFCLLLYLLIFEIQSFPLVLLFNFRD